MSDAKPNKVRKGEKVGVVLLSGGNPQIAKADGDAPVQAYIVAMPGWKWRPPHSTLECTYVPRS